MTPEQLPAYSDLILPTIRAVAALGGSATAREVSSRVVGDQGFTDEMLAVQQPSRPDSSVLMERVQWARSYAKLIGALESPNRGVFLVTALGKDLLAMPQEEAQRRTYELDREYRRGRAKRAKAKSVTSAVVDTEDVSADEDEEETPFVPRSLAQSPSGGRTLSSPGSTVSRLTPSRSSCSTCCASTGWN